MIPEKPASEKVQSISEQLTDIIATWEKDKRFAGILSETDIANVKNYAEAIKIGLQRLKRTLDELDREEAEVYEALEWSPELEDLYK